jgi:autotransporter-associated beta strand protein
MKTNLTNRLLMRSALVAGLFASQAIAATFEWDASGGDSPDDGPGAWNPTGGTNWWNTGASQYGPWGNTTADTAVFGMGAGEAGTLTVGQVTANKITFNAPGSGSYTLAGGTLTLGGASPTLTANSDARIDSTISSTAANAFIRGAGTLTLGGTATFTGGQAWEGLSRYVPANSTTGAISVVAGANITAKNFPLAQDNVSNLTQTYNQTGGTVTVTNEFGLGGSTVGGASNNSNIGNISGGTLTAGMLFLYKWATCTLNVSSAGTVNATTLRIGWVDSSPTGTINIGDGATFSGGTNINDGGTSGTLKVNAWSIQNNRSYTLNFNGGTLKAGAPSGNWLQAGAFTNARVLDAGGIIDNGGLAITINQVLSHGGVADTDGGLVIKGTGITTLGGGNTYNGATTVNAGSTLRITGALADSAVTVKSGGTFGGRSISGAVTVASGGSVEGGIGGSGTLTTDNLTLGTTTGDTSSLIGTVSATAAAPINVIGDFNANGGAGSVSIIAAPASGLADGTYDFLTWIGASNIADVSVFKFVSRSMTPVLDLPNKVVQVTYNSAVSSIYWTGGSSAWNASATGNWKQVSDNADTTFMPSDAVLFHDTAGSGVVDISNGNVMPVAVTFDNTAAGTAYTLQGTNGLSSGTFTKVNDGTLTITNTNPTTGAVIIHGGTVSIAQTGGLGTGNLSFDGGATLEYTGASTVWSRNFTAGNAIGTGGGKVAVTSAATLSGGTLSGAGDLLKTGIGTLAFSGSGGYSGSFTVSQGTLQLNNTGGTAIILGDAKTANENVGLVGLANIATPITVSAANAGTGTVTIGQANNFTTLSGLITLNRATTINTSAGDRAGITGKITGNVGTLTFTGIRTTLDHPVANACDFTGNVVVDSVLQMNTIYGLPATASVTVNPGRWFRTIAGATIDGLNGTGTVNNNSGGGAATTPLSLGNNGGGGNFSGILQNGSGADIISIIKNGVGTQILGGNSLTYTGATTVNGGTLQIDGTKTGAGAVIVKSSATLAGSGSVNGTTTVEAGGFVAPANTTINTLTLASATIGGTYQCQLDAATCDLLAVTGTLTVDAGTNISFSGIPAASEYTIVTYGTLGGALPTIVPPSGYALDVATAGQIKLIKTTGGYTAWADGFPGLTDKTPGGDPDGDGIKNLLEYVIGGDPRVSSTGFLPKQSLSGGNLVLSYQRSDASETDTTQTGQWSPNLTDWNDLAPVLVNENGTAPDDMEIRIPLTHAVNGKLFGRLHITQTP